MPDPPLASGAGAPAQGVNRLLLGLGLLIALAVFVLIVPGNPILDLNDRRYRTPATILSHVGGLVLLAACWPCRHRWLAAVANAAPRARRTAIAAAAVLPQLALLVITLAWPHYARALARESGPTEPLSVVLYLATAWVARETARVRRARGLTWRPYQLLMLVFLVLVLEEMDYFHIPGALLGRVGGRYVGTLHDLINLATWFPIVWPPLVAVSLAAAVLLWRAGGLSWEFLWTEARVPSTVPLYIGAVVIGIAEVADIEAEILARLGGPFLYAVEEPLELLGGVLLLAGVLLKYCRDAKPSTGSRDG